MTYHGLITRLMPAFDLFRHEAVYLVIQPHGDSAIPKPANPYVDFAVVYVLQFTREVHNDLFVARNLPSALIFHQPGFCRPK